MASNTIKGLTVEIGADTTKLGKALKAVEARSRSLSKELGDINKLLKLDPGNADLLAQKQKVLGDAAKAAADKLEILRDAEKQVQAQFERGEVSEEQLRALQREIVATENKMKGYQKAAQQTAQEIEKLGDGSNEAGNEVKETGDEAKKSGKKVDDFGDSAKKAEKSSGGLGKTLAGAVKKGLTAVGAVCAAAITGLVAAAESTREYRTEMGKLDTAFTQNGFTSGQAKAAYTELVGIIGETDQAVEAANHLAKLTDNEKDLAKWTGDILPGVFATFGASLQPEALAEAANETARVGKVCGPLADALNWAAKEGETFGVTMKANTWANKEWNDAVKNAASTEDFFNLALQECSTEQERQALITQTLAGYYGDAAAAYKETNAEVIRANQANDAWMQSLAGIGGAIEPIITDIKLLGASLLSDAVPHVERLAAAFRGLMNGDAGASGDFAAALGGLVTGLVDKINQALPGLAQVGFSIIKTLGTSLLQQAPTLLTTAGQLVGQLAQAITTQLPVWVSKGAELLGKLGEGIKTGLPGLLSKGLDILMGLATALYDNAPVLLEAGIGFIKNLVQGILNSLPVLLSKGPELVSKLANIINDNVPRLLKGGMDLVIQIGKGIIAAIPSLIQNAGKIFQAIIDVWQAINWINLGKQAFTALKNGLAAMGGALKSAGQKAGQWIVNALKSLPGKLLQLGKTALTNMRTGITSMAGAIRAAGGNILKVAVNAIKALPSRLLSLGKQAITFLGKAIQSGIPVVKSKATSIVTNVVATLKTLPSKVLSVGKNMVQGIWKGISGATSWIKDKIKSWVGNVTDFLKRLFGIESPSTVMRDEVGRWLPAGIAEGVDRNAKVATNSMAALSRDMVAAAETDVGGLNFERGLSLSRRPGGVFGGSYAQTPMAENTTLLAKLDAIYERLNRLQVVLDTGATVGGIVDKMDAALAAKQALHARGV